VSINCDLHSYSRLSPRDFSARSTNLVLIVVALMVNGCGGPSETARDNRRLMDAILTAITIRNNKELSNDLQLLNSRRDAGKLSKESFSILCGAVSQAETGDWIAAEQQLYDFRKQTPFPK
jgi:hypothetical protein